MSANKELNFKAQENEFFSLWKKTKASGRPALLAFFKQRLEYLQHERLIHLLVTLFFGAASLFLSPFVITSDNEYFIVIFLLILIPAAFYVLHYYRLENACQRWQKLALGFEEEIIFSKK